MTTIGENGHFVSAAEHRRATSSPLTIEQVHTGAQLRDFIVLPRLIYSGMPGFVAPLDYERRQMLDPRHNSFFTHGRAAYWIAMRNGRPQGRI